MGWEASEISDAQLPAGRARTAKQQACARIPAALHIFYAYTDAALRRSTFGAPGQPCVTHSAAAFSRAAAGTVGVGGGGKISPSNSMKTRNENASAPATRRLCVKLRPQLLGPISPFVRATAAAENTPPAWAPQALPLQAGSDFPCSEQHLWYVCPGAPSTTAGGGMHLLVRTPELWLFECTSSSMQISGATFPPPSATPPFRFH